MNWQGFHRYRTVAGVPNVGQRTDRHPLGKHNCASNRRPFANGQPFEQEFAMAKCEACGNDYDKSFQVVARGKTHTFDTFPCLFW